MTSLKGGEESFDVVVVGGGGAGLAAAIEASRWGRSVVILEKNESLGGSTALSVGSISASSTPHQIKLGIKDTPEDHFEDLAKFNGSLPFTDNETLRRVLTENVPETMRWLLSMGVRFFGPMPEPPHRRPRMHNVLPNSGAYIYHLGRAARRAGVALKMRTRARRLILENGIVVGVEATNSLGEPKRFLARGGVVLASGDFSASEDLKRRFSTSERARIGPTNPANTGDGQSMAVEIGGRILNGALMNTPIKCVAPSRKKLIQMLPAEPWLTAIINWAMINLPPDIIRPAVLNFLTTTLTISPKLYEAGAILINRGGARFCDELDNPVLALAQQPEQTAYIIFDHSIAEKFSVWPNFLSTAPGIAYAYLPDYRRSRSDIVKVAPSIGRLAKKIGVPTAALEATLNAYSGQVTDHGHVGAGKDQRPTLARPPFYSLGPVKSVVVITDGGLAIDEKMRVLDQDDRPIQRLFAAGSAGQGGLLLDGHGHHLGWAFTSGRIAGRNAAFLSFTNPE